MTTKNDGGPAFPGERKFRYYQMGDKEGRETVPGMSLRDYFAAKAMQARISDYESMMSLSRHSATRNVSFAAEVAAQAYDMADAMLAARNAP